MKALAAPSCSEVRIPKSGNVNQRATGKGNTPLRACIQRKFRNPPDFDGGFESNEFAALSYPSPPISFLSAFPDPTSSTRFLVSKLASSYSSRAIV